MNKERIQSKNKIFINKKRMNSIIRNKSIKIQKFFQMNLINLDKK
jgi:hypothetical protein